MCIRDRRIFSIRVQPLVNMYEPSLSQVIFNTPYELFSIGDTPNNGQVICCEDLLTTGNEFFYIGLIIHRVVLLPYRVSNSIQIVNIFIARF